MPSDNEQFRSNSHSGAILEGLNHLRNRSLLFDVSLLVEGITLHAHKVVLASCSEYFRALFTDAMLERQQREICLNGVTVNGMGHLIDYAYTSNLSLSLDNVQDVLSAASHVQMETALNACSDFLLVRLDHENCVDIATIAEHYNMVKLEEKVYRFMSENLFKVSKTQRFADISISQLSRLLRSNYPTDCPEVNILSILIGWIGKAESRISSIPKLLGLIRYGSICPLDLKNLMSRDSKLQNILTMYPQVLSLTKMNLNSSSVSATHGLPPGLVNPRGYECAIVKTGGFTTSRGLNNSISYYHLSSGAWKKLTIVPHVEQCNFSTAVLQNSLYVAGGSISQDLEESAHPFVFRYQPGTDRWQSVAPMLQDRSRFYLTAVNKSLYAIGGATETEGEDLIGSSTCEKYNPETNSWNSVAHLSESRMQHSGSVHGRCIYISGGLHNNTVLNSIWCYDTLANQWTEKSRMLSSRADHSMLVHENKIYIVGGWHNNADNNRVIVDTVDSYDISDDRWETVTRMPTPRYYADSVILDNTLYVLGGFTNPPDGTIGVRRASKTVDSLSLNDYTWQSAKDVGLRDYPEELWEHSCCTLYIPTCREDELL